MCSHDSGTHTSGVMSSGFLLAISKDSSSIPPILASLTLQGNEQAVVRAQQPLSTLHPHPHSSHSHTHTLTLPYSHTLTLSLLPHPRSLSPTPTPSLSPYSHTLALSPLLPHPHSLSPTPTPSLSPYSHTLALPLLPYPRSLSPTPTPSLSLPYSHTLTVLQCPPCCPWYSLELLQTMPETPWTHYRDRYSGHVTHCWPHPL